MPDPLSAERFMLDQVLPRPARAVEMGLGLYLSPRADSVWYEAVVGPAMRKNGLNKRGVELAFDEEFVLASVMRAILSARIIVADVTQLQPALMYVLGLCHGVGRCPLLITRMSEPLPFDLQSFRRVEFDPDRQLWELREDLTRAIRVMLIGSGMSDVT